ncbi:MAG: intradiol ring-cleavage dioxygenase, partial [Verrucomicrobiaceae bacterium]|nr:intradiol ring-cleavage dioxygenase [Verrucomicrobiaceae bacterium]
VFHIPFSRRRLLRSLAIASAGFTTQGAFAEALLLTPRQTEGPYYPDHLPVDQDSDLIHVTGDSAAALGTVTNFGGRLLNAGGKPISSASIELWQADNNGCYIHSRGTQNGKERDSHFQGFGKVTTNEKGEYRFRTIMPGLYTGRTRHYHIAVMKNGKRMLTTQLYIAGESHNDHDGVLNGVKDEAQRLSVIREFKPVSTESKELVAAWDIVMGTTPEDPERHRGPPPGGRNGPGGPPPGGPGGPGGPPPRGKDGRRPPPPSN